MGKFWDKGATTMWAAWRQGLKELAQILPAFPTSVRPVEEVGGFGNPTQMEVNQEKGTYEQYLESKQRDVTPPQRERQAEAEM